MLDDKGFDLWASDYDSSTMESDESESYPFAGYSRVLDTIYGIVIDGAEKSVLDIGFGTGVLTKRLYDNGISITGIDFSQEMIGIARKKMPLSKLICRDFAEGLPPGLGKFDFIILTYSIHHLSYGEQAKFISELLEHLNDGGKVLIGDIMFRNMAELEACRTRNAEDWDEDEFYIVADELPFELKFEKISSCAGICSIEKSTAK